MDCSIKTEQSGIYFQVFSCCK